MPRHLIFDRDSIFSAQVVSTVKSFGIAPTRTAYRSPWQNGMAERWVGSVRRELLDQIVVWNERHLRRLLAEYVAYYHDDRTHLGLDKETPGRRTRSTATDPSAPVVARPRLAGFITLPRDRAAWEALGVVNLLSADEPAWLDAIRARAAAQSALD